MNQLKYNPQDFFLEKYLEIKKELINILAQNKNQIALKEAVTLLKKNYESGISEQDIKNAIINTKNIAPEKLNVLLENVKKVAPKKFNGFINKKIRLEFKEDEKGKDVELIIMEN